MKLYTDEPPIKVKNGGGIKVYPACCLKSYYLLSMKYKNINSFRCKFCDKLIFLEEGDKEILSDKKKVYK